MKIEIERGFNGCYLLISDDGLDLADDELCMLLNNKIPGLLNAGLRNVNGGECLSYDISSMVSLTDIVKKQELKHKEIIEIIRSFVTIRNSVDEYLLTENGVIMSPEYVFYDMGERSIKYCYYPFYKKEMPGSLNELAEFILRYTDHADKRSVKIIYELYEQIQNGDYNFSRYLENAGNSVIARTGKLIANAPVTKQLMQIKRGWEDSRKHVDDRDYQDRRVTGECGVGCKERRRKSRLPVVIVIVVLSCVAAGLIVVMLSGLDLF